jgi:hypothetical protein
MRPQNRIQQFQCDCGSGFDSFNETAEVDSVSLRPLKQIRGPRGDCLMKNTEGKKSHDTVPVRTMDSKSKTIDSALKFKQLIKKRLSHTVLHRVETKMHFSIFAKMQKSLKNRTIFTKFRKILFQEIFFYENFCKNLMKILRKFLRKKSIKFDSDKACMVHVMYFFAITSHFRRIKKTYER